MSEGADRANSLKGEVEITFGAQRYVMRPSFAAIMAIEAELGGVVPLARRAAKGDFGLKDLTVIIREGLLAHGTRLEQSAVGAMILTEGLANVAGPVRDFLTAVLSGRVDHNG
jgi:hypothetical protein